jgi:hypothetical protein
MNDMLMIQRRFVQLHRCSVVTRVRLMLTYCAHAFVLPAGTTPMHADHVVWPRGEPTHAGPTLLKACKIWLRWLHVDESLSSELC